MKKENFEWRKYTKTDKNVHHGYGRCYDAIFHRTRHDVKSVLEVGVQKGYSIQLWLDYFPNATITGVDIEPESVRLCRSIYAHESRVSVELCDASMADSIDLCTGGRYFDVVIDDGSHKMAHQEQALLYGHKYAKSHIVIEDLHTSRMPGYGQAPGVPTFLDFCLNYETMDRGLITLGKNEISEIKSDFNLTMFEAKKSHIAFFDRT